LREPNSLSRGPTIVVVRAVADPQVEIVGEMKKTGTRITSFDVAALAGVSQSVVSRAFKPGTSIAAATRTKVIEAAQKLNYVPNSIASSLTTNRSNIVAIVLGNLDNPFYVEVFKEFSQRLQDRGRQVLSFTLPATGDTDDAIRQVLRYQVDGLILTSAQLSTRMISLCHDRGIRVALFNRYIPMSDIPSVRCDNVGGARLMAEHLLAAGAKTFAMITGDSKGTTSQDRARGFVERLLEAGVRRADILSFPGYASYVGGVAATRQLVEETGGRLPDAIFGINDAMAMAAMDELRFTYGKRIPDDVMVAGFDGIPDGGRAAYRLTTVRQPVVEMVTETLRALGIDELTPGDGPREPERPLAAELIWRDTIRSPKGGR
jgi:DNA-binding LacI/PurR family transcriptional regulator